MLGPLPALWETGWQHGMEPQAPGFGLAQRLLWPSGEVNQLVEALSSENKKWKQSLHSGIPES